MRNTINGLWRFYDEVNNISGITCGSGSEEAHDNAVFYIKEFFNDIKTEEPRVAAWPIEDDDDYHCNDTIAIAY